ncbi:PP2C family protein-serine/threonine phosphatase [Amycolatopsis sp. NBC_01286]|uniref:PP2C family protein-serine/threonine phosphatase n=1 Tax=Amycolatopsis sp. NBC_01286 TaxID=2903560 RepID=UPI002E137F34|nr:protein phosphatase 2C domain-containing protein [Amycolatopsis sp. NBC_01286]
MSAVVKVAVTTGPGLVRAANEDRLGVFGWLGPLETPGPVVLAAGLDAALVAVVADGLGGHLAGEVASLAAVSGFMADPAGLTDETAVRDRCLEIHADLLEAAAARPDRNGMGTTLSAVVLRGEDVLVCNVGDSRVYYVEPGLVEQLTADDVDPLGSGALTQVLGGLPDRPVSPRISRIPVTPGLRLLLCTDGLHGVVSAEVLRDRAAAPRLEDAVAGLALAAAEAGAPDNVSICFLEVTASRPAEENHG